MKQRILTLLLAVLLLSACYNPSTVMSVDGSQIRCGTYLFNQIGEAENAVNKLITATGSNVTLQDSLDKEIEGVSFSDYVRDKTIDACKRYVFTENAFSEYGLSIPNGVVYYYDTYCQNQWVSYSDFYLQNGISYETFLDSTLNAYKYSLVFSYLYTDPSSPMCISDEEMSQCYADNYRTVSYIKLPDANNDSSAFNSEQEAKMSSLADSFVEDLDNGTPISELFNSRYDDALAIGNYTISVQDSITQSNLTEGLLVSALTTNTDSAFLQTVLSSPVDSNGWVKGNNGVIYVYSIGNHTIEEDAWKEYKSYLAEILRADDFDAYVKNAIASMTVELDEKAMEYYSISKIKTATQE